MICDKIWKMANQLSEFFVKSEFSPKKKKIQNESMFFRSQSIVHADKVRAITLKFLSVFQFF